MPNLASVEKCFGCAACANVCPKNAIKMIADKEGFLQPVVDELVCVKCGLCERTCPVIAPNEKMGTECPRAYAAWHKEDRRLSSSGGMFSAFARKVIDEGGFVFGASLDSQLTCSHLEVSKVEDLTLLRGSKYMQSAIGNAYKQIRSRLNENKKVLFCGTSCQVAGLRKFLRADYENLLTIDLTCHGVPSNLVFKSYVTKLQGKLQLSQIKSFEFRRRDGWGMFPSYSLDGISLNPVYGVDALYMSAFDKSALFRKSCYTCPYTKIPRVGDITLADFWGLGRYGTAFKHDVLKGVSLVLANTEKGAKAINALGEECFIEERSLQEALVENHNLKQPSALYSQRDSVIADFLDEKMSLCAIDKKYGLVDHSLKGSVKKYASKLGIFDIAKRIYNKVKTL